MKILIPCKRVPDPDQPIKLDADGTGLDLDSSSYVVNPFDLIAVEEALRLRENIADLEIVAVGIGSDAYDKELRTVLAMGADRALLIETDQTLDPWNVAKTLQAIVEREQPNLVLMGKQAIDDDSNQVGQFLAALLDWPQATFISKLEWIGDTANIDRETDAGIESATLTLPAVLTADLRLNEPRYASMLQMMKAKKKTIDRLSLGDLAIEIEPRVELLGVELLTSKRDCQMLASVDDFVCKLRDQVTGL